MSILGRDVVSAGVFRQLSAASESRTGDAVTVTFSF